MNLTVEPPNGRGCGDRKEGDLYACCGTSAEGMPMEFFILDPARPIKWERGVKIIMDSKRIYHMVIFVGIDPKGGETEGYHSAWSFAEEGRHYGFSRKMTKNLPFEKLTPGKSRMWFVHAKAIPQFDYKLDRSPRPLYECKYFQDWVDHKEDWQELFQESGTGWHLAWKEAKEGQGLLCYEEPCTHALRDLAWLCHPEDQFVELSDHVERNRFRVKMPSFEFTSIKPESPWRDETLEWASGAFLSVPLTHFEIPHSDPKNLTEKANQEGWEVFVTEW